MSQSFELPVGFTPISGALRFYHASSSWSFQYAKPKGMIFCTSINTDASFGAIQMPKIGILPFSHLAQVPNRNGSL
jgi:hypothetical protein